MSNPEIKEALKEALKEWMDDKFATFGRYSVTAVSVAVLGAVVFFWIKFGTGH